MKYFTFFFFCDIIEVEYDERTRKRIGKNSANLQIHKTIR